MQRPSTLARLGCALDRANGRPGDEEERHAAEEQAHDLHNVLDVDLTLAPRGHFDDVDALADDSVISPPEAELSRTSLLVSRLFPLSN